MQRQTYFILGFFILIGIVLIGKNSYNEGLQSTVTSELAPIPINIDMSGSNFPPIIQTSIQPSPSPAPSSAQTNAQYGSQWYTSNQINYNQLDYEINNVLQSQVDDIMSRWPVSFAIGQVVTKNIVGPIDTFNSQIGNNFAVSAVPPTKVIPKVSIGGSIPSNIKLNFVFPPPSSGVMGDKGETGADGQRGPDGPQGPAGPPGYWT